MIKLRHVFLVGIILILCYNCANNNNFIIDPFDHEAQALIDKDSISKFLDNYYFDDTKDSIKPLIAGKTPLSQDNRLIKQTVTENDISYDLYHIVIKQGEPQEDKGFPTPIDSILPKYQVWYTTKTDELSLAETGGNARWWDLSRGVIRGWSHGFVNFKGGNLRKDFNGPITFDNGGRGILIIPSGLAYRNSGDGENIPANAQLIFYVELFDFVKNTDHDNDGLASSLEIEDINTESDPRRVDTDNDTIPNYLDSDDDGDGVLTKDEDANGDGDPRNDDADGDGIPDYLDPDTK